MAFLVQEYGLLFAPVAELVVASKYSETITSTQSGSLDSEGNLAHQRSVFGQLLVDRVVRRIQLWHHLSMQVLVVQRNNLGSLLRSIELIL